MILWDTTSSGRPAATSFASPGSIWHIQHHIEHIAGQRRLDALTTSSVSTSLRVAELNFAAFIVERHELRH